MWLNQDDIVFDDRWDAGRQLAEMLTGYRGGDGIVLALPRGGVQVGFEVAQALGLPLDVMVARKIGAPAQPELGIGAVAPGGVRVVDPYIVRWLGLTEVQIDQLAAREEFEMERRIRAYRGDRPFPELKGRTVILVDDGLATGVTARAAIEAARKRNPAKVVLAAPLCAGDTATALREKADEVVCVATPIDFRAVGLWYRDFTQVTDEEVVDLLARAAQPQQEEALGLGR